MRLTSHTDLHVRISKTGADGTEVFKWETEAKRENGSREQTEDRGKGIRRTQEGQE